MASKDDDKAPADDKPPKDAADKSEPATVADVWSEGSTPDDDAPWGEGRPLS